MTETYSSNYELHHKKHTAEAAWVLSVYVCNESNTIH